jgi:hypothetical protein
MRASELNKDDAISLFSVNSPGRPARLQGPPSRSMDRSHKKHAEVVESAGQSMDHSHRTAPHPWERSIERESPRPRRSHAPSGFAQNARFPLRRVLC